jgi:transposase
VLVAELQKMNRALTERVAELEARVGQSPRNSHKPPGSEGYEKPAPKSRRQSTGRKSGGQPGHQGRTLSRVQHPDDVFIHEPAACSGCGASLAHASVVSTETRQVFDLPPIRLAVAEHCLQHRRCDCGATTMADVPAGAGSPAQYGPGVRGLATYLLAGQYLPLARTAELLTEQLGAPISQGSLATWHSDAAAGLEGFDQRVKDALGAAEVLGADETGIRVEGSLAWVHAARTDSLTRYTVSTKRGFEAMAEAGVLPKLSAVAVLVSDFWSPYWSFDVLHAVCGAHLGRELIAAAEAEGQTVWVEPMDRLLTEINNTAHRVREIGGTAFAPDLLATYRARYNALIEAGWAANPDYQSGKRGKGRRPKHVNLLNRLDTHRHEVLRYAEDLRVPFTNNGSEQDVRPLKIRMKIAGSLRTMTGAESFCRLRSYLSTARKQGRSAFESMRALHDGNPWIPAIA